MTTNTPHTFPAGTGPLPVRLPEVRDLYYGGAFHKPKGGYANTHNPADSQSLGPCAEANAEDVDAAVQAAKRAYPGWKKMKPFDRAALLRQVAAVVRSNALELALLDAANCGAPVAEMQRDVEFAATSFEYFAGLVSEAKGETVPMGDGHVNLIVREPYGVVGRIVAYNHPLLFLGAKSAAPLAAGNTVVMKPPVQAPLSAYRFAQLIDGILPPGVFNIVTGGTVCGAALTAHPDVPVIGLVGSVETGRAVMRSAADRIKRVSLELGGKNALVVYPDADLDRASSGAVKGMNFTWNGQSCGSTSRLFVHESVHDEVVAGILEKIKAYRPGIPTDPATTQGAIVSKAQFDKVMRYIDIGQSEGATIACGGKRPDDPALRDGHFIEATVFTNVRADMRIAREEIFGPVLSVIKWSDEEQMFNDVNAVEYGLTGAVFTRDLANAHRAASRIEAGLVWVNNSSSHFLGTGFGGYKQSGLGRDESLEELMFYTQPKNINITL